VPTFRGQLSLMGYEHGHDSRASHGERGTREERETRWDLLVQSTGVTRATVESGAVATAAAVDMRQKEQTYVALVHALSKTRLLGVLGHGSLSAGPYRIVVIEVAVVARARARARVEFWTRFVELGLGFVGLMCDLSCGGGWGVWRASRSRLPVWLEDSLPFPCPPPSIQLQSAPRCWVQNRLSRPTGVGNLGHLFKPSPVSKDPPASTNSPGEVSRARLRRGGM
jgi:hypothetical protein